MSVQVSLIKRDSGDARLVRESTPAAMLSDRFYKAQQHLFEKINKTLSSFNLDALKDKAENIFGTTCTGCYLVAQGGFNTVFILTFKDRDDVVARLLGSRSGNDSADLEAVAILVERKKSEVAIHHFLKKKTTIPVPHIYYFDPYFNNPVMVPFMLMERVHGRTLADVWHSLSADEQTKTYTRLIEYNAQLLQLEFNSVGSLYNDGSADEFTVGPLGGSCTFGTPLRGFQGPFTNSQSYLLAHAEAHLHSLLYKSELWKARRLSSDWHNGGADGISIEYATTWLQLFCKGVRGLPAEPVTSILYHDDLGVGNIIVSYDDPTNIVAVIDWEGSRVLPIWENGLLSKFIQDERIAEYDADLAKRFGDIENSIYSESNPQLGRSRLNLGSLVFFLSDWTMAIYSREVINQEFLQWFQQGCKEGYLEEIRSFSELKDFIEGISRA
ncbi:kinase-like domain-containing protein [Crucibulum laeve]|uniref:Kinase-like domain-containing protein n=1 Tax=Crucibulum laeve TaxID=68775 RepID=A0A5C3MIA3_9AGAR|nr:kinase-like domain-containing protein [Crucibulum laeve]